MKSLSKYIIVIFLTSIISCTDYLEVPFPTDSLTTETTFGSKATIDAAILGIYSQVANLNTIVFYRNYYMLSDEFVYVTPPPSDLGNINISNLQPTNIWINSWANYYSIIFRANTILEQLPSVGTDVLTTAQKNEYLAEAKYLRAWAYFIMINAWGDVPLVTTTKVEDNINIPRAPVAEIYKLIEKDLTEAKASLTTNVNASSLRIHNQFQIDGLLSRVYLYQNKWTEAESSASNVISSNKYQLLPVLNDVFKRNSKEVLFSVSYGNNSVLFKDRNLLGWVIIPANAASANSSGYFSNDVLQKFDKDDNRSKSGNWTINLFNRTYCNKFLYNSAATSAQVEANPQDFVFQRLSEIYLIRAEARAQQNKLSDALADINVIRKRAGVKNLEGNTKEAVMLGIENERQFELFYEGHRWLDLKRWGKADQVLSVLPHKKDNYKPHHKLLPISVTEIDSNPSIKQNEGYN